MSALQLSHDPSVNPQWFRSFETSTYGGTNSLDLTAIARPDASYDFVICNHVLEHIADDLQAFRELVRIVGPRGIVQITVPNPVAVAHTRDWGYAREDMHGHYRMYGADFEERFRFAVDGVELYPVLASDDVTEVRDLVYFCSQDQSALDTLRQWAKSLER
jgi:SAM-dependent methyltransferase